MYFQLLLKEGKDISECRNKIEVSKESSERSFAVKKSWKTLKKTWPVKNPANWSRCNEKIVIK